MTFTMLPCDPQVVSARKIIARRSLAANVGADDIFILQLSTAAEQLPYILSWIARKRDPDDPTPETIVAEIGLAKLIFEVAGRPQPHQDRPLYVNGEYVGQVSEFAVAIQPTTHPLITNHMTRTTDTDATRAQMESQLDQALARNRELIDLLKLALLAIPSPEMIPNDDELYGMLCLTRDKITSAINTISP